MPGAVDTVRRSVASRPYLPQQGSRAVLKHVMPRFLTEQDRRHGELEERLERVRRIILGVKIANRRGRKRRELLE